MKPTRKFGASFFRDHFSASTARSCWSMRSRRSMPAGSAHDLEAALSGILDCFRIGRSTILSSPLSSRIDRILFGRTKAIICHHQSHDRLEAVLRRAVARRPTAPNMRGLPIDVVALSAVRATREARSRAAGRSCRPYRHARARRNRQCDTFDGRLKSGLSGRPASGP